MPTLAEMLVAIAEDAGYLARTEDKPRKSCSYKAVDLQLAWLSGWDKANNELWEITIERDAKVTRLTKAIPGWREMQHENGNPMYGEHGMLLTEDGNRSIFDDVDE